MFRVPRPPDRQIRRICIQIYRIPLQRKDFFPPQPGRHYEGMSAQTGFKHK